MNPISFCLLYASLEDISSLLWQHLNQTSKTLLLHWLFTTRQPIYLRSCQLYCHLLILNKNRHTTSRLFPLWSLVHMAHAQSPKPMNYVISNMANALRKSLLQNLPCMPGQHCENVGTKFAGNPCSWMSKNLFKTMLGSFTRNGALPQWMQGLSPHLAGTLSLPGSLSSLGTGGSSTQSSAFDPFPCHMMSDRTQQHIRLCHGPGYWGAAVSSPYPPPCISLDSYTSGL